jgi:hypothetical protein
MDWASASFAALGHEKANPSPYASKADSPASSHQTLLDRLDNLQTLLFIIHAVGTDRISIVHGDTYKLIPALLVPRILWPDKPRTHEGQVLLNVHFGRQDLFSTYTTYVAWGLLPEAYANFGPMLGAAFLGVVLGLSFAWLENFTARKLVVSLEGFIAFDIILSMLNSFEMVASVLVTSAFQSLVPIALACLPFVRKTRMDRPTVETEPEPPPLE